MKPDYQIKNVKLYNCDNMDFMREIPDKHYDLAVVDPPYGIGAGKGVGVTRGKENQYTVKEWDSKIPDKSYFDELFRISKNQIVCGGNYFANMLPNSRGWIYWRKMMGGNYADGELLWTSFDRNLKEYTKRSDSGGRFHPTQKLISLYKWILVNYAEPGDKIFDSHGGSFSSACACLDMGFDFDGCEIDQEYFDNAVNRLKNNVQDFFAFV